MRLCLATEWRATTQSPKPVEMGIRELVGVGDYKKLITARFLSNIGNGMSPIAMSFGVLELEGTNEFSLSIVMFSVWVPMILLMLFGGVIADRVKRTLLVGGMDLIAAAITVIQALLFMTDTATVPLLCLTNVFFGIGVAMWWPAFGGLMPEIIQEHQLQSANSMMGFMANFGNIIGAFLGGSIVAFAGPEWALLIDGASFVGAGLLVLAIRVGNTPPKETKEVTMLDDLVHGWREVVSRQWVIAVIASFAFINMAFESVITVLGPLQFDRVYHGARDWGIVMGSESLGMLFGVVLALKYRPRQPLRAAMIAILLPSVFMFVIGLHPPILVVVPFAFMAGVGIDIFAVLWMTAVQSRIPTGSLSRVFSYDALGSNILVPLGLVIAGPLAARTSPSTALIAGSVIAVIATLLCFSAREVRHLPEAVTTDS